MEVFSFIEKQIDYLIPIVIFPLTGGYLDTVQFSQLINNIQKAKKVYIVLTQLENLIIQTNHLIREDDDEIEGAELKKLLQ